MPILDPHSMEFISRTVEQTRRLGMRIGARLQVGDIICLIGDLGAGKTTLVQGVASGWGTLDPVFSPSYVLVNVYRRPDGGSFYHLDAYRLSGAAEAVDLDLDTLIESGPLVVEWAERILSVLPRECMRINLRWIDDEQRDMVLAARGERYERLLAEVRQHLYGDL